MKQNFTKLFFIALSAITINASAQVKLGVTAGTQLTFTNTDFVEGVKSVAKPTFGIVAQANLGGGFMFRPSVNYVQEGLKSFESITTQIAPSVTQVTELTSDIKTQNLQIPLDVVVGLKAGMGKVLFSLAPVVTIGLNAKFNTSEVQTTTGLSTNSTTSINQSGTLDYKGANAVFERVDWGGRIGVGYEFKNGIQLNAAYKAGLNDIAVGTDKYKSNSLTFTLSYFLIK
jgi:hypothetical protein